MLKYTIHHKYHLISIAGVVFYDECLLIWWQLHYLFMFTSKIDGNTLRTLKTQNTIPFPRIVINFFGFKYEVDRKITRRLFRNIQKQNKQN